MTHIVNNPESFAADAVAGFCAAFPTYVQPVHGGVVRTNASPRGEVAIVVGGGSGHYPAFAGWVGPGLAHGSVCGNIFASPSASQVESVVRSSDNGGGTLLLFGNYAGDVLHFGAAAASLKADGIDTRIVTISDDVASNSPANHLDRRGIAGDLMIVKVASAAAARGDDLDGVENLARKANDRTRSLGIAFSGCTLPGADEPLFTVDEGTYALGLGIHGEPGLSSHPLGSADDLAALLVDGVLAEEPPRGTYDGRLAVLVNGLGATKYEELFVLFGAVNKRLAESGHTLVAPVVGEQVTSLDMAGASLTVMFLDDELEQLWTAPADSPAFKTGTITAGSEKREVKAEVEERIDQGSPESVAQATAIAEILALVEKTTREAEAELGKLDSIAGDGDHGQGMVLGATAAAKAAAAALDAGAGAKTLLVRAGKAWAEGAGGTSGALWGGALVETASHLSDETAVDDKKLAEAVCEGGESIRTLGGAQVGDKTMVDAVVPFVETLRGTDEPLADAWVAAARAATEAAEGTKDLAARKGRARTHGDSSLGHPDPGAISFALLMTAIGEQLKG